MNIFDAVLLGIVEGLTEFLPVSSTGHLILTSHLLGLEVTEALKTFEIVIQLGAMCAVVALYIRSFFDITVLKKIVAAFVPTAIIGYVAYPTVKAVFLGNPFIVAYALAIGGIVIIAFEYFWSSRTPHTNSVSDMTYRQALLVGLAQTVALVPGVSRSAATILGGLSIGISRATIVEFSFLLAVPTIAAASGLDLLKSYSTLSSADMLPLAVGFIVSFIVALMSISFLLRYIRTNTFVAFGIYRIVIAAIFIFVIL